MPKNSKSKGWASIPNPMSKDLPKETSETAYSDITAVEQASGLTPVYILSDDGRQIPALVDQSSRTVYPKRTT